MGRNFLKKALPIPPFQELFIHERKVFRKVLGNLFFKKGFPNDKQIRRDL